MFTKAENCKGPRDDFIYLIEIVRKMLDAFANHMMKTLRSITVLACCNSDSPVKFLTLGARASHRVPELPVYTRVTDAKNIRMLGIRLHFILLAIAIVTDVSSLEPQHFSKEDANFLLVNSRTTNMQAISAQKATLTNMLKYLLPEDEEFSEST
uniref:Uncharacterized protein n=1 Tax=Romanomermis culicivorax TaxID=13658 RepID=A0A915IX60_ROMCU